MNSIASIPHDSENFIAAAAGRRLVLHADDFGMNAAVNRGILAGFAEGLLTSTSILTNAPAFSEALEGWRILIAVHERGELSSAQARSRLGGSAQPFDLGVHLNLTQGFPLTGSHFPSALLDADGRFLGVFRLFPRLLAVGMRFRGAVRDELGAQIERLLDQGLVPTHLNGHQYIELFPVVTAIVPELLQRYSIGAVRVAWEPGLTQTTIRHRFRPAEWGLAQAKRLFAFDFLLRMRRSGVAHPDVYFGTAHAGRIDLDLVRRYIQFARPGLTEIGVHPGTAPAAEDLPAIETAWNDPLEELRPRELDWIRSRELVGILSNQQIDLGRIARVTPAATRRTASGGDLRFEPPQGIRAPRASHATVAGEPGA